MKKFVQILALVLSFTSLSPAIADCSLLLLKTFAVIDANDDGKIDPLECNTATTRVLDLINTNKTALTSETAKFDVNQNGSIDSGDYMAIGQIGRDMVNRASTELYGTCQIGVLEDYSKDQRAGACPSGSVKPWVQAQYYTSPGSYFGVAISHIDGSYVEGQINVDRASIRLRKHARNGQANSLWTGSGYYDAIQAIEGYVLKDAKLALSPDASTLYVAKAFVPTSSGGINASSVKLVINAVSMSNARRVDSFGTDGAATFTFPGNSSLNDFVVTNQAIYAYLSDPTKVILKLLPDGKEDANFGYDGSVHLHRTDLMPTRMLVRPDGRIVMVGFRYDGSVIKNYTTLLNPNGWEAGTFDIPTIVSFTGDRNIGAALGANDSLFIANNFGQVVKVNDRGGVDFGMPRTFGTAGVSKVPLVSLRVQVSIQKDEKVLVGVVDPRVNGLVIAPNGAYRLLPNGKLDTSFGANGYYAPKRTDAGYEIPLIRAELSLFPDMKIFEGGHGGFMLNGAPVPNAPQPYSKFTRICP